ncbi:hypothetical protein KBZ94_04930 [Streptomyces sp. RM72]|uniref:hypothetical protein n=1 Tax=unclassified Streptomyces TaxID=2593676 RepID=UPI00129239A0|nr:MULTISPECIES: hypothetical protein [unclassified Streptomyces]MBQ0884280.1 hypothetical protein [Streptomyces sp. RM72]
MVPVIAAMPGDGEVLGADTLLPSVLLRVPPGPGQLAVFKDAVAAHPPRDDAAPTVVWSHWAMTRAPRRTEPRAAQWSYGREHDGAR